jgi:hypothetical protein
LLYHMLLVYFYFYFIYLLLSKYFHTLLCISNVYVQLVTRSLICRGLCDRVYRINQDPHDIDRSWIKPKIQVETLYDLEICKNIYV